MKQFCTIHHFYFDGNHCPFCEKERLNELAQRYVREPIKKKNEDRKISQDDLDKLVSKFNRR